jgi:hypothetical protein
MDELFKIIGAVITGLGGSSVIIIGLSSWLGKIWANRIFEKERSKYEIDLEDYKKEINKEMQKLRTYDEKALHMSKIQYDKEFEIYQDIWKAQIDCFIASNFLFPKEENIEYTPNQRSTKLSEYIDTLNKYLRVIQYSAPFYKEDFFGDFQDIFKICSTIADRYRLVYYANPKQTIAKKDYQEEFDKIKVIQERLRIGIQNYLKNLRIE